MTIICRMSKKMAYIVNASGNNLELPFQIVPTLYQQIKERMTYSFNWEH